MNYSYTYDNLISIENIFQAWDKFKKRKLEKKDVQEFYRNLEDNLFELHRKLKNKTYRHGSYQDFYVNDPKRRHIHKAQVSDRIVHHLLYKYLYDIFDKTFIYDSYSCRLNKGTHKAVGRLDKFARKVSKNYSGQCWALKCDIKKFFASVDHKILLKLLERRIKDKNILWLIGEIIDSFQLGVKPLKGIPLGNLTSQIFANIYMNELDQFAKHRLNIRYYLRYADDFVIISKNKKVLQELEIPISNFLSKSLKLKLHSKKIIFRRLSWGIEFLGCIVLSHYSLVRTKTKKRIFTRIGKKIIERSKGIISDYFLEQTVQSYLGILKHSNGYALSQRLKNEIWFSSETLNID